MDDEVIQKYVDEFVGVVGAHGLSEEAYEAATIDCIKDALFLASRGTPVNKIVSIMNSLPKAGEAELRSLAQSLRRAEKRRTQSVDRLVAEQQMAGDLIRASPTAFAAELHALFLTSEDEDELAVAMAELFKLHTYTRNGNFPDLKRRAISMLSEDEKLSLAADCQEIVRTVNKKET